MARLARAVLAIALGGVACTPDFQNATTVVDLRLLGVVASPPEILIDLEALMRTGSLPDPLPDVVLAPLVVDPKGAGRPVWFRIDACANSPDEAVSSGNQMRGGRVSDTVSDTPCGARAVRIDEGSVRGLGDGVVPFATSFTPTLPFLIAAAETDPLGVELGLPIGFTFTVRAGDEEVVAYKRVLFSRRLAADQVPNQNPVVTTFYTRPNREAPRQTLDPANPPAVALGGTLRVAVGPAQAEAYSARAFSTRDREFYTEHVPEETLRYNFYATHGTFSPAGVNNDPSPLLDNPTVDLETTYNAPSDPALRGTTVDVFVVVRDERGGASFARTKLRLE